MCIFCTNYGHTAIRDSGISDRNVRWSVALRRLEERYRGE